MLQPSSARLAMLHGGSRSLLSVREVAARLSVSTYTVYALCDRGELVHVRISNAIRIAPEDLARYLDQQRVLSDRVGKEKRQCRQQT